MAKLSYRVFGKRPRVQYEIRYGRTLERAQSHVRGIYQNSSDPGLVPDSVVIEVSEEPKGARRRVWRLVREYRSYQELVEHIRDGTPPPAA